MNVKQSNFFLRFFAGMIANLLLLGMANSSDILFHEKVAEQAIIYRVSSEGTNLKKIGHGLFPQWSPDGEYISYVESFESADSPIMKAFVVIKSIGKEVFRIDAREDMTSILLYSWNPTSKGIALVTVFGRYEGSILYYDIKTKQIKKLHRFGFEDLDMTFITTSLEWTPDGKHLLFSSWGLLPKELGMIQINVDTGIVKNLSDKGRLPRFIEGKVLFTIGTEIWTVNLDGSDKKKIYDTGMPIISLSRAVNNRIILQMESRDLDMKIPFKLYLLNFDKNIINLNEIKPKNYLLLCPNISIDGKKFTAIGMKLKNKEGQLASEEEEELGYYIFDIGTEKVTLLKKFEDSNKDERFLWGIYGGYGNYTSWGR